MNRLCDRFVRAVTTAVDRWLISLTSTMIKTITQPLNPKSIDVVRSRPKSDQTQSPTRFRSKSDRILIAANGADVAHVVKL